MANWFSDKMHENWRYWSRASGKNITDPEKIFNAGFRAGVKTEALYQAAISAREEQLRTWEEKQKAHKR